jgi:hypothetical protein
MRRIAGTVQTEVELVTRYHQNASPAYFDLLGYTGEYPALTQADNFGVPFN